jgi:hypothetical protein
MIDVSDGLVQDLGHVCRASRVRRDVELATASRRAGLPAALGARAGVFAGDGRRGLRARARRPAGAGRACRPSRRGSAAASRGSGG